MNFFLINNHYGKSIFQNMSILVSKVVLQTIKYCLVFGFEMVKIGWSRDKKLLFFEDSRIFPFKRPFLPITRELRACGVEQAFSLSCSSTKHARNSVWLLPQGYCERKPLYLEKTISSVLSVLLLIYGLYLRRKKYGIKCKCTLTKSC